MRISPVNNQSYTRPCDTSSAMRPQYDGKNVSHKAVNQKHYNKGRSEIEQFGYLSYVTIDRLANDVMLSKKIHPQDGADTLRALREKLKPRNSNTLDEFLGIFNNLAKEARVKQRKLKKH